MYKCDKTEILSLSSLDGYETIQTVRKVLISEVMSSFSTCHSVSDMSITIVLNFFYIYLYILCTKSVFFKLDKKSL